MSEEDGLAGEGFGNDESVRGILGSGVDGYVLSVRFHNRGNWV